MGAELAWMNDFLADWRTRYPAVERTDTAENASDANADPHTVDTDRHRHTTPIRPKSSSVCIARRAPRRNKPVDDQPSGGKTRIGATGLFERTIHRVASWLTGTGK
jgi:hypothetical protein